MNTVLNEVLDVAKLNPATTGASTAKSANLVTERYVQIEDVGMRFVTMFALLAVLAPDVAGFNLAKSKASFKTVFIVIPLFVIKTISQCN